MVSKKFKAYCKDPDLMIEDFKLQFKPHDIYINENKKIVIYIFDKYSGRTLTTVPIITVFDDIGDNEFCINITVSVNKGKYNLYPKLYERREARIINQIYKFFKYQPDLIKIHN